MLVTKVLLNCANGVFFGPKEPYMAMANPFVAESIQFLRGFYSRLSAVPTIARDEATMEHVVGADMDAFCPLVISGSRAEEVEVSLSIIEALLAAHAGQVIAELPPAEMGLKLFLQTLLVSG